MACDKVGKRNKMTYYCKKCHVLTFEDNDNDGICKQCFKKEIEGMKKIG